MLLIKWADETDGLKVGVLQRSAVVQENKTCWIHIHKAERSLVIERPEASDK